MSMKQDINVLLGEEVNRLDFLKRVAAGAVAVTGAAAFVKAMTGLTGQQQTIGTRSQVQGYGASVYGGVKPQA